MFRKQILENAIRIVCQDRRDKYGQIEDNFGLIADLWSSYLGASVTAVDVAMMMGMLKMARIKTGKYTQDNFVDLAGYAACGAECTPEALQEKERRVADVPEPIVEPMRSPKKKKSGRKKQSTQQRSGHFIMLDGVLQRLQMNWGALMQQSMKI